MNAEKINLSDGLNAHVQALSTHTPDSARVDAAQQRLEAALATREAKQPSRRMFSPRNFAYAGFAAVLALVGLLVPVLFTSQGNAFAAVQQRLRDFTTLTMTISQESNGTALPEIRVWTDRKGDTHTDVGDTTTVIVNADSRTILTLLHSSHQAMRMPIPASSDAQKTHALDWLKSIQRFKGKAQLLPGTRMIDGVQTHGWSLDVSGMHIVLWADNDNIPRAININSDGGATYTQHIKLSVDTPINAAKFSTDVPVGYKLMNGNAKD